MTLRKCHLSPSVGLVRCDLTTGLCHNSLPTVAVTGIGAHLVFILDVILLIYDLTVFSWWVRLRWLLVSEVM